MRRRYLLSAAIVVALLALAATLWSRRTRPLVITGIVTTDSVTVGSEIEGRVLRLLVREGDSVKAGELLAVIEPRELRADVDYYENGARQAEAQVAEAKADLRLAVTQTESQIRQAQANLDAASSQAVAGASELENARLTFEREQALHRKGADSTEAYDAARTARDGARARLEALHRQVEAADAVLASARANADAVAAHKAAVEAGTRQLGAARAALEKARAQLDHTEIRSPINGVVDVRAALPGEVVDVGQAVVTLIDLDDLWVRADVEEGLIDRIRLGDSATVRLPSGAERSGVVFYRGVDADFATQRDVSRTKRDIKTFETRLRCDNADRALAVGMTATVIFPAR